jgi:hypothetical protein
MKCGFYDVLLRVHSQHTAAHANMTNGETGAKAGLARHRQQKARLGRAFCERDAILVIYI